MQRIGAGELRIEHASQTVRLDGWVHRVRNHGGVVFFDLRDRSGIAQVVVSPDEAAFSVAQDLHPEWVIEVVGTVRQRQSGSVNPNIPTGTVEIAAPVITVLSAADAPPILPSQVEVPDESVRLRYRYLDLRRPDMQENLRLRHRALQATRSHLDGEGFTELETPMLTRSTPEGARDFLVPSRLQPGAFYALPQSPQLFKQLLMVSGFERYFQVVRCFRDEDLRADRQPEFTQIDIEMSFVAEDDVLEMAERLTRSIVSGAADWQVETPFPRLTWAEAMRRFGSDKPDLRIPLEITDLTQEAKALTAGFIASAIEAGGVVRGLRVPRGGAFSRKDWDGLGAEVERFGFKGVAWLAPGEGEVRGSLAKFASLQAAGAIFSSTGTAGEDAVLLLAGAEMPVSSALGHLRLVLADRLGLREEGHRFLWVTDFPLFEWSAEEGRAVSVHHPFTHPHPDDVALLEADTLKVRAQAYDLVLDGTEVAGGSIRIHERELQSRVFSLLGLSQAEADSKFGFLLEAFRFGAPPHGGIAFGFDRMVMILAGAQSIREVIAFPKTAKGTDLMTQAPSEVSEAQLKELHLRQR